ncbi:MAG: hypothetical protein IJW16_05625 [Clostridia bacterium]|nr:hypothetical protein [Clostridia bacterium]
MNKSIEDNLTENGFHVSTTSGYSMYPMLRNRRDRVIIKPIGEGTLRKHDLPLYRRPDGKYVLHRILKVKDDHYVIRGDNTYALEYVPKDWVIGYVTEFYRGDRHYTADSRAYRAYAAIWHLIYPLRLLYRKGRSLASRVWHKIKRK